MVSLQWLWNKRSKCTQLFSFPFREKLSELPEKVPQPSKALNLNASVKLTPNEIVELNNKAFTLYAKYWRPRLKKKFPSQTRKEITTLLKARWQCSNRKTHRRYRTMLLERSEEKSKTRVDALTSQAFDSSEKTTKQARYLCSKNLPSILFLFKF